MSTYLWPKDSSLKLNCLFTYFILIYITIECLTVGHAEPSPPESNPNCYVNVKNITFDLSPLRKWNPWNVTLIRNDSLISYQISICDGLTGQYPNDSCAGGSVCKISNGERQLVAKSSKIFNIRQPNIDIGTLFIQFEGPKCLNNNSTNHSITFILSCGPHLGQPFLYTDSSCLTSFTWATSVVCSSEESVLSNQLREVPCSVYDKTGRFYDLTPLINKKQNHLVETHDGSEFMAISVCSFLANDNTTSNCPRNVSSCIKKNGNFLPAGSLTEPLKLKKGNAGLELIYQSEITLKNCSGPSKTVVDFRCPSRGKGKTPELILSSDCLYNVYWETEFACPVSVLSGDVATCKFQRDVHGVDIDLSALRRETPYNVSGIVNGKPVEFYLNICGGLGGLQCGKGNWRSGTVCMKSTTLNSSDTGIIYGNIQKSLKYISGEITLEYPGTVKCSQGQYWKNIIKFDCDPNASQSGTGYPKFIGQEDCVNWFEFKTKYACAKNRSLECELKSGPLSIILNPIYRHHSYATWKAIDSLSPVGQSREIYLNLCDGRDLMGAPQPCSKGTSICVVQNGTSISLAGKTETPKIKYEYLNGTHTYQIEFEHGDPCPHGFKKSTLILECDEMAYTSSPVLVSETQCEYKFLWKTYAACQHQRLNFHDCKFEDKERGVTIDLNPLKSSTYYKIEADEYDYFINICGPVTETSCSKLGMKNARGCQVKKDTLQAWSLGDVVAGAAYDDGELINITYTGGTPYRDPFHTPRSMSITLICDLDAGNGAPVFNGEENRVYSFLWRTSLVCGTEDTVEECVIYDSLNRKQYDLSRLSKLSGHDDWSLMDPNGKMKFYLNICRPLNKPKGCDKQSAACLSEIKDGKETGNVTNLGKAVNVPKVTSTGHLQLHYTMGDTCVSFNKVTNYSVLINFICNSKALESQGPKLLGILGNCSYSFLWVTEAACPIGKEEFHECSYTDTATGYHFDLNPLHKKDSFYEIKTGNKTFQVNICGPVGGNGCNNDADDQISVCEVNSEGKSSRILGYAESGVISQFEGVPTTITYLGYRNGTFPTATDFEFECDHSARQPTITYDREETGVVFFTVATSLVCAPEVFDCSFTTDEGIEYDLSSLVRNGSSYWTIRDSDQNRVFHLSVCGAITGVGGLPCHGAGICAVNDTNPHEGLSLGTRITAPRVEDDTVVISFKNGSPCQTDTGKNSAVLTLHCSSEEKPIVFERKLEECVYYFSMETPAACPVQTYRGDNCLVRDPIYNHVFDLSPLINETGNYVVTGDEHTYLVNVCGSLSDAPAGCEEAAVCQVKDSDKNFSVNAGKPNSELIYNDGLIQLIYRGGKSNCHKKYERSTIINFICDHSTEGLDGPRFLLEDYDCTYVFEWATSWACPPFVEKSCSVEGPDGRTYNLGPLSNPNNNYVIENPVNSREKFVINVCRSVVHKPGSRCAHDAATCLVSTDNTKYIEKSKSLGTLGIGSNPVFENGVLKIHYVNGDLCRFEGSFEHYRETSIEFKCDETAMDSQPEFLAFENCQYTFIWFTPYACPVKSTGQVITGDCSVVDSETGQVYDFSSLRGKEISVQSSPNHKFALSICQELKDSTCGIGTGSCQMEHTGEQRTFSSGIANSNIILKDGAMSLIYSNGTACHSGSYQRSTIIRFLCDKNRSVGESRVSFVNESSDCTYLFNWHTKLACEMNEANRKTNAKESCKLQTKQGLVDLSPAVNEVFVTHSTYQHYGIYFLSLCDEIKNNHLNLPKKASAACLNCSPTDSMDLGHFVEPPFVNDDNVVQMNYKNGSVCLENPSLQMSSSIYFICDKMSSESTFDVVGSSEDECTMYFEFRSVHACPIKPAVCSYGHEDKGFYLELAGFEKVNENFEVVNGNDKYVISICKPLNMTNCTGAGICLVNERGNQNFGLVKNSNVFHNTIHMTLTYDSDMNCSSSVTGKRHTEIKFYCDQSAGIGKPQLYKKYSCRLIFLWATAEVCSDTQPVCTLWTKDQKLYDLRILSSISHSWNVTDKDGNEYWLNLCREIPKEAVVSTSNFTCPPFSSACIVPPNSTTGLSIGSVLTQKIRIDDLTNDIVVTYDHGDDTLCTLIEKSHYEKKSSTEIRLKCGRHTGFPKLVSKDNCEYKFIWETHIACPEMKHEPMYENKGLVYDMRLHELGIVINITSLMENSYEVTEPDRKDDFIYVINLGQGVSDNISDPICQNALVCQTKRDRSFFRDIGTKGTQNFYLKGSEMKLIITSHGRKCGKNKSKNVTSIINFQCSRINGLGYPEFKYESGDCDYVFYWATVAVCPFPHITTIIDTGSQLVRDFNDLGDNNERPEMAASTLSVSAIVAIIFAILIALILAGVLVKKERRNAIKLKTRQCFQRMRLPRYQYMQCYFLRLRGDNAQSRADGEAVLLSPDDPLPRFNDDSDVDPIA